MGAIFNEGGWSPIRREGGGLIPVTAFLSGTSTLRATGGSGLAGTRCCFAGAEMDASDGGATISMAGLEDFVFGGSLCWLILEVSFASIETTVTSCSSFALNEFVKSVRRSEIWASSPACFASARLAMYFAHRMA